MAQRFISFYAFIPGSDQKRFKFKVPNYNQAIRLLSKFQKNGFIIKAAWYQEGNIMNHRFTHRINLSSI